MPTVPTAKPTVEQAGIGTPYQSMNASPDAFGAAQGRLMEQGAARLEKFGTALEAAAIRQRNRDDAVARANDYSAYQEFGSQQLQTFQQAEDLSNPKTLAKFRQTLEEQKAKILSSHAGSADSRAQLEARLTEYNAGLFGQAAAVGVQVGRDKVNDVIGKKINTFANTVAQDPRQFRQQLEVLAGEIEDFNDVITDKEKQLHLRTAIGAGIQATVDVMLQSPNGAKSVQQLFERNPDLVGMIEPQVMRAINREVASARAEERKMAIEREKLALEARRVAADELRARTDALKAQTEAKKAEAEANAGKVHNVPANTTVGVFKNDTFIPLYTAPKENGQMTDVEKTKDAIKFLQSLGIPVDGDMVAKKLGFYVKDQAKETMEQKYNSWASAFTKAIGRAPNDAEKMDFFGVKAGEETLDQKIAAINATFEARGMPPLTDSQVQVLAGVRSKDLTFAEKVAEIQQVFPNLTEAQMAKIGNFLLTTEEQALQANSAQAAQGAQPGGGGQPAADQKGAQAPGGQQPLVAGGALETGENQSPEAAPAENQSGAPKTDANGQPQQKSDAGGEVRPLNPDEAIQNADGSVSTERSITVTDQRLNGGQPTNIPTIWSVNGQIVELPFSKEGEQQAIEYAIQSGQQFDSFGSISEAVTAAEKKSAAGGRAAPKEGDKEPAAPAQQASRDTKPKTIFELADLVVGPANVAGRIASENIPDALGGGFAEEQTQAKTLIEGYKRDLVRAMQNSPRYAEGEREAIEKEVDLSGGVLKSATAFRQKIMAIDEFLANRQKNYEKDATNPQLAPQDRLQARRVAEAVKQFREVLLPPRVKSAEDYEKVQPGELFLTPDGKVKRKRGKAAE